MSRRRNKLRRKRRRVRTRPGAPPGEVQVDALEPMPAVWMLRYGPGGIVEDRQVERGELSSLKAGEGVLWVAVAGLGDAEVLRALGQAFGLHKLTVEDLTSAQRPKSEHFESYDYILLRAPASADSTSLTQLSVIVGDGFLLSFEEAEGAGLEPIYQRLRFGRGLLRGYGADYLAYAMIDLSIDRFFPTLERIAERIEELEPVVLEDRHRNVLPPLYAMKQELRECQRGIWPLRDLINALIRDDQGRLGANARLHLRDCRDHVVQLIDQIDESRETATSLMELHVSNVGNRMNEVMQVLTIISTIFIPLSFIAGVYGMNFDDKVSPWNMPELRWYLGYPAVLLMMAALAAGMLLYFRRKGWLGGDTAEDEFEEARGEE